MPSLYNSRSKGGTANPPLRLPNLIFNRHHAVRPLTLCAILLLLAAFTSLGVSVTEAQPFPAAQGKISGALRLWHRIAITFNGPDTSESAALNPFTDYRLNVTFTNGTKTYVVPGFYAADGSAAQTGATTGNKWRVYFTPDTTGLWMYTASFRTGTDVAMSDDPNAGTPTAFDGAAGSFTVRKTNKKSPDFRAKGMLRYVGERYLRFAGTGEPFLKMGAGSPENFLAYREFDGTYDTGGILPDFLHQYAPHLQDWQTGDPQWQGRKGRGIIGGLNYLASQGVNSLYLLTYTIDGGDGADVWPWTSHTERLRFDVSKLDQWEIVFTHMTRLGIQLHLFTQENENDQVLGGSSGLNNVRKLYYRELVARFAHHPALQWNIGEENDNTLAEKRSLAAYIRALDPYDHPIAVHSYFNLAGNINGSGQGTYYDPLLGAPEFNATSMQGEARLYNYWTNDLRTRSANAGQPWVIYGDEQGPAVAKDMNNVGQIVRQGLWGNLMGGGAGTEWYFGYQDDFGDLQSESWRVAEPLWTRSRPALAFFRKHLPFWEMTPDNALIGGDAWVLAKPEDTYVVYFPSGVSGQPNALDLKTNTDTYSVRWFDPVNGGALKTGSTPEISGSGAQSLGQPPYEAEREWAALVRLKPNAISLLHNGGFEEVHAANPKRPKHWEDIKLASKDRVICGNEEAAAEGNCGFRFAASPRVGRAILQAFTPLFEVVDGTLTLSIKARGKNALPRGVVRVRVTYSDGTREKWRLKLGQGTFAWTTFEKSAPLREWPTQIRVIIAGGTMQGKLFLDDVKLVWTPGAPAILRR